ncbi:MAG: hypothetical protein L6Q54_11490 [Leptospiraceae bacterium]|nr:hypothetical protein [Leptospiraceae bacterium]MCK6381851.1 hypothetical protein [Leptospiraceae bacterium]
MSAVTKEEAGIVVDQEVELSQEIELTTQTVESIVVNSEDTLKEASEFVLECKRQTEKVVGFWSGMKSNAHKAWKGIVAKENEMLEPIKEAESIVKKKISVYLTEVENKRIAEQKRLDEERRIREEAERKKLEEKIEKAELNGKEEKAEELKEQLDTLSVPVQIAESEIDKITRGATGSVSQKKKIIVTVSNEEIFLKEILEKRASMNFISYEISTIKKWVEAMGIKSFPGLAISEEIQGTFRKNAK